MTRKILVTGFEPFGGDLDNPSGAVAKRLDGEEIGGCDIVGITLPVVFGRSRRVLNAAIRRECPEVVICLGLAGNRSRLSLERIAINLDDASIPDNEGNQPTDQAIVVRGQNAYWSTLPIKAIGAALGDRAIPVEISHSAGTYVCNHVFYGLMHGLRRKPEVRGGFIHVPKCEQPAQLTALVRAMRLVIETVISPRHDAPRVGGVIS